MNATALDAQAREAQWDLLKIKGIENLPAIQWKIMNIRKMEKKKHAVALEKLKRKLDL